MRIQDPFSEMQDHTVLTEISFSPESDSYVLDFISKEESFRLAEKKKHGQTVLQKKFFATVPETSGIFNYVKEQVLYEASSRTNQQINFHARYRTSESSSAFFLETEKLLLKPYNRDFWVRSSYIIPDPEEFKQIRRCEYKNMFFSIEQSPSTVETVNADTLMIIMNKNLVPVENVYVETDRQYYLAGDTIWFNVFVLENLSMDSSSLSKILYVDLINSKNLTEKHIKLLINNGCAEGDFVLARNTDSGLYRLRAYTQYMRNFQEEFLFEKEIPIYQTDFNRHILVEPVINKSVYGDSIELHIKTILPDEYSQSDKTLDVTVRVNDSLFIKKAFIFKKVLNDVMGFFVQSSLYCKSVDVKLTLSDKSVISTQKMNLDLRSDILLQFFPESGKLIDGIETIVAYKSTDNQGIPREFTADIIDENKNIITHIVSDKHGTGKFSFLPRGNHIYRAVLTFPDSKYVYNLPVVEPEGYIINFNPYSSNLSLRNNQKMLNRKHYLMISVRGMVHSLSEINISNNLLQVNLPFKSYPKGIMQVTLLDSLFRPQAERLIFNNRPDRKMFVQIETDKREYAKKEKVNLTIRVSDTEGNPVEASLSMSVIDAEKSDSLFNSPDIESYLYLASELKGRIDYNSFNLSDTTADSRIKTDLLMMTQGWRNFLWNSIRYRNTLNNSYSVEKGFFIDGILLQNGSRKSKGNYSINVLDYNSGFNEALKLDRTNRFEINIPLFYNSHVVLIQNRNQNNRIENLDFQIDTADYPAVGFRSNEIPYSHYNKNYFKALNREFAEADSLSGKDIKYINLPEVRIKAKSNYSYSTPNIELDLGKKDPSGKKYNNLFQMIYEEFGEKAFTGIGFNAKGHMYNPILVVDGRPYTASICPPCYSEDYHIAAEIPVETISDVKFYEAGSNFSKYLTPPPGQ